MKILVTGFGSFLENEENPTEELLKLLPKSIRGNELIKIKLPVIYDECFDVLRKIIDDEKPDYIYMLGLAGDRTAITPERVAININDARGPDNIGRTPVDEVIVPNGKNAYFSTLPIKEIVEKLQLQHIPAYISNTAGTYVCNNIFYHTMHYIDQNDLQIKAGFIHVPFMTEQLGDSKHFSLKLYTILEGIIDAIKIVL